MALKCVGLCSVHDIAHIVIYCLICDDNISSAGIISIPLVNRNMVAQNIITHCCGRVLYFSFTDTNRTVF